MIPQLLCHSLVFAKMAELGIVWQVKEECLSVIITSYAFSYIKSGTNGYLNPKIIVSLQDE